MSDKEKAAEEWASEIDGDKFWRPYSNDPSGISGYVDAEPIAKQSFLAGCDYTEAKFRPVKIEKDRPETWPKLGQNIILWYYPNERSKKLTWCGGEVVGDDDGLFVDFEIDGQPVLGSYAWAAIPEIAE